MLTLYIILVSARRRSAAPVKPKVHYVDGTFSCAGKPIYPPQIYNVSEDVAHASKPSAPSTVAGRILVLKVRKNPHVVATVIKEALRASGKYDTISIREIGLD